MGKGVGRRPSGYRWTPEEMDRAGVPPEHPMRYWDDYDWALASGEKALVWPRHPQGRDALEESDDWPAVVATVKQAEDLKRRYRGLSWPDIATYHLEGVSPDLLKKYRARYRRWQRDHKT